MAERCQLELSCAIVTIELLRAKVAELEALVAAQAKVIEGAERCRSGQYWGYAYDAAKAELEKVRG